MDKATLLDKISSGYAALETLLTPLDEAQMTTRSAGEEWSIKDILAHLTAWHYRLLGWVNAILRNEEPALGDAVETNEQLDRLNARFYEENKTRPLSEVLSDLRSSHLQVIESVQAMADEDLTDPQRFAWMDGNPFLNLVAGNTYEHYLEHIGSIQERITQAKRA